MLHQQLRCCGSYAASSRPLPPLAIRAQRSRSVKCLAVQSTKQDLHARTEITQASKALLPYVLWDRVTKLTASWDTRGKADFHHICEILQPRSLGKIVITQATDAEGQPLTYLTIICKPKDGDDVAAALLQYTPATHITATPSEQCYLPHRTLPVQTAFGSIDVDLSLAGSNVKKVTPNWVQCQAVAEQQQNNVDAAAVAAAAVEALSEGLRDGSIQLDAHLMF
ncbi:hypothetical protein OEZ85_000328 [Tetradesmus obliquus]|uniref:Uncharacterized protein n=1 Tax=Tetradesmus obliquus TaxID=3088 RepID=A0ABY8UQW5_TETOB|nr:hypothetical protein OEZ85_000328 [Tetradesmus obliquus]